ncbi:MAG: RNA degradosome polyphosphate kinase, partial [Lachnospiraceae bacterium]|nr:RNA degradosome polyphosphate kinase [Lachnospiraceae bacterium]
KIELIVRGICCLKTYLPGIGDRISVRSIVGNFLEHSRIFFFENDGKSEYYCASADWMPRNLERRVEIMFPVDQPQLQKKLMTILNMQLRDTVKAHILTKDGTYEKVDKRGKGSFNSQLEFCQMAVEAARMQKQQVNNRVFIPETHHE